jgi:hypothetical protein
MRPSRGWVSRISSSRKARWAEDCSAGATNETGLDHHQVRTCRAWYRHVTLVMLSDAFLAVAARTCRLFNRYTRVIRREEFREHWPPWRRRRQASARTSHYARRT